jgi:hypothetical protein
MSDTDKLVELLDAKLAPIIAEIKEIKASQKGEQSALDVLSDNLDQDRRDISEVRTKTITIESRLYELQDQLVKGAKKTLDKVEDTIQIATKEILSDAQDKAKKIKYKSLFEVIREKIWKRNRF